MKKARPTGVPGPGSARRAYAQARERTRTRTRVCVRARSRSRGDPAPPPCAQGVGGRPKPPPPGREVCGEVEAAIVHGAEWWMRLQGGPTLYIGVGEQFLRTTRARS